ncbi:hypothetical protein KEJ45_03585 [Candidatus Bathyarchaeota archaeon]|nr:hypothetical protein [Candidatus Bathyarchaeota archaeon]
MFLGILQIILSTVFGLAISTLLKIIFTLEERVCFSIIVGCTTSTILIYVFSSIQKTLNFLSIIAGLVCITIAAVSIFKWRKTLGGNPIDKAVRTENLIVLLFAIAAFSALNLKCVLASDNSNALYGSLFIQGDYSFHVSVINSFAYRDNFPPQYPIMVNASMNYPFMVDFLSSILIKTGFDLRSSIIIPNVLLQASTLYLVASLASRLIKKRYVGVLSALMFFFAGNMGIIYAINDAVNYGDFMKWITSLPTDYSGSSISPLPEMRFGNPIAVMLMPQRSSMLGIGISLVVYILVLYALQNSGSTRELVFAGILSGVLPSVHPHSFIAVSVVFFFLIFEFKKDAKFAAYFLVPLALLALPQVLIIQTQVRGGFMGLTIGWLNENLAKMKALDWSTPLSIIASTVGSISILAKFWLMNIGLIIVPFAIGLLKSDRLVRQFYSPYITLFVLGNFVRFQPWDWDNYKIFMQWHMLTVIVAAYGIIEIARLPQELPNFKRTFLCVFNKPFLRKAFASIAVVVILFFSMATGFLSHAKAFQESYLMWSDDDVAFADWIRENTPPESLFLTSTHYLHPVVTIAGRQIVLGYEGWLWSHGIDWSRVQEVKKDVIEMFKGNYTLIKAYGVNFIVVTKYERMFAIENNFRINVQFFMDSAKFEKVYDQMLNGYNYMIFKVL